MSVELAIHLVVTVAGMMIVAGGLLVKVNRLEADVKERVSRELFDAHTKTIEKELSEIKAQNQRILDRLYRRPSEDTNPGA